jgi:hypothetical protein
MTKDSRLFLIGAVEAAHEKRNKDTDNFLVTVGGELLNTQIPESKVQ